MVGDGPPPSAAREGRTKTSKCILTVIGSGREWTVLFVRQMKQLTGDEARRAVPAPTCHAGRCMVFINLGVGGGSRSEDRISIMSVCLPGSLWGGCPVGTLVRMGRSNPSSHTSTGGWVSSGRTVRAKMQFRLFHFWRLCSIHHIVGSIPTLALDMSRKESGLPDPSGGVCGGSSMDTYDLAGEFHTGIRFGGLNTRVVTSCRPSIMS
ncbi:hypothetical protein JB92DRAFT_2854586 [Gautieria morchelliformis]|nr:hypothetical protein JB92DRAFT_2854586 [Gautieria morchelliformis]